MGIAVEEVRTSLTTSFGACHSADHQNVIVVTFIYKITKRKIFPKSNGFNCQKWKQKFLLKLSF